MSTDVIQTEKPGKRDPRGTLKNSRVGMREQHTKKPTDLKPTKQKKNETTLSYLSSIEQPCIFSNITFYVLI